MRCRCPAGRHLPRGPLPRRPAAVLEQARAERPAAPRAGAAGGGKNPALRLVNVQPAPQPFQAPADSPPSSSAAPPAGGRAVSAVSAPKPVAASWEVLRHEHVRGEPRPAGPRRRPGPPAAASASRRPRRGSPRPSPPGSPPSAAPAAGAFGSKRLPHFPRCPSGSTCLTRNAPELPNHIDIAGHQRPRASGSTSPRLVRDQHLQDAARQPQWSARREDTDP